MGKSQTNYQKRKWFEIWRSKFLNKNHYNYLCEIQRSLSQKKSSSVSFDLKKGKERVHSLKRLANSAKRAASPVDYVENVPVSRSASKSPTKSPAGGYHNNGGILKNRRDTLEVFRNLTNDFQ